MTWRMKALYMLLDIIAIPMLYLDVTWEKVTNKVRGVKDETS